MSLLIKRAYNTIQEKFGKPVSLYALLAAHPDLSAKIREPVRNISHASVVRWHEWEGEVLSRWPRRGRGILMGWRYSDSSYGSFSVEREEFSHFVSCEITEDWECEIQNVTGLAASKSKLEDFESLDKMVETNARKLIEPCTADKLRENLAWGEIRILHRNNPSDFFARYLWDGRVFFVNSGGSHHFAAGRYVAARIEALVPLRGKLCTYSINKMAVASLQRDYEMFVMAGIPTVTLDFRDAMQNFRASYLWHYLPHPYQDCCVVLLPRADARSMKVAAVLHAAGFFDLGLYLAGLAARQSTANP